MSLKIAIFLFSLTSFLRAEACDQHSWCNVTMHTATEEGELFCPHGAPLVAITNNISPSQWSINCPAEEDTQYYRSSSWTQDKWNDTIIDSSFHCPPNSYISGLRISEFDLLGGVCTDLGSFSMDEENCRDLSLFTYRVGTVNLDRGEVITSVNMIPILSSYIWIVFRVCLAERVKCEVPDISHGHAFSERAPDVGMVTSHLPTREVGERITITCDEGYYLHGGEVSAVCQQNGTWTTLPTCRKCRPIEDCESVSCSSAEDSICLRCSSTGHTPFQLGPSNKTCDCAPLISIHPVVWSGRQATISCTAHGRPAPSIHWELNGEVLSNTPTTVINSTALTVSATVTVHGYYLCRTENALGVDTILKKVSDGSSKLSYQGPPVIRRDLLNVQSVPVLHYANQNDTVEMRCIAFGGPSTLITWERRVGYQFKQVSFSDRVEPLAGGSILFSPVDIADAGYYRCRATNQFGTAFLDYLLLVRDSMSYRGS